MLYASPDNGTWHIIQVEDGLGSSLTANGGMAAVERVLDEKCLAGRSPRRIYFPANSAQVNSPFQQYTMGLYTGLTPSKAARIHLQDEPGVLGWTDVTQDQYIGGCLYVESQSTPAELLAAFLQGQLLPPITLTRLERAVVSGIPLEPQAVVMLGYYHMPTPSFNPDVTHIRHNVKFKIGTESFKIALRRAATNVGSMSMGCSALGVDFVINRMGLPESAYPRNFPGDLSAKVVRFLNVKDVRQLLTAPGLKTLQEADGTKGGVTLQDSDDNDSNSENRDAAEKDAGTAQENDAMAASNGTALPGSSAAAGSSKKRSLHTTVGPGVEPQFQACPPTAAAAAACSTGAARELPFGDAAAVIPHADCASAEAAEEQGIARGSTKRRKVRGTVQVRAGGPGEVAAGSGIAYPWGGYPYSQVLNLDLKGTAAGLLGSTFHKPTQPLGWAIAPRHSRGTSSAAAVAGGGSCGGGSAPMQAAAATIPLASSKPLAASCGSSAHRRGYAGHSGYSQALPPRAPSQSKPLAVPMKLKLSSTPSGTPQHTMQPPLYPALPGGTSRSETFLSAAAAAAAPTGGVVSRSGLSDSLFLDQSMPEAAHAVGGWAPSQAPSPSILPAAAGSIVVPHVAASEAAPERPSALTAADVSAQAAALMILSADARVAASVVHAHGANRRKVRQPISSAAL